jgi:hypothetical protein
MPGVEDLVDALDRKVISTRPDAVARRVAYRAIMTMAAVQRDPATSPNVAAILSSRLDAIGKRLAAGGSGEDGAWASYVAGLLQDEQRLLPMLTERQRVPEIPPGMPIGGQGGWFDE